MYITRKMDYAMRMLLVLARHQSRSMTSEVLSSAIEVPRQFTLKIAQSLTKAGIIKAQRGVGGGIELARPPESLTLHEIFMVTDTPRALNECLIDPEACTRSPVCAAHYALRDIQSIVDRELKRLTLADLVRNQQAIVENPPPLRARKEMSTGVGSMTAS